LEELTSETAELQRFIVYQNNSYACWAKLLPQSNCSQKYFPSWTPSPFSCPDSITTNSPRIYVPPTHLVMAAWCTGFVKSRAKECSPLGSRGRGKLRTGPSSSEQRCPGRVLESSSCFSPWSVGSVV